MALFMVSRCNMWASRRPYEYSMMEYVRSLRSANGYPYSVNSGATKPQSNGLNAIPFCCARHRLYLTPSEEHLCAAYRRKNITR